MGDSLSNSLGQEGRKVVSVPLNTNSGSENMGVWVKECSAYSSVDYQGGNDLFDLDR